MNTFILTSDCDHLLGDEHIFMLRNFADNGIFVTTAVFNSVVEDKSWLGQHCTPVDTEGWLDNEFYKKGLIEAKAMGHELAFHGNSQVSNTRKEFLTGIDKYNSVFGEYPFTYVEHGPNPKHQIGLGYKEELLNNNVDDQSIYYIKDVIKEVFSLTWTQDHLITSKNLPLKKESWFTRCDDITYFRRCRMLDFDPESIFRSSIGAETAFIGYTHFGYEGYFGRRRQILLDLFRNRFSSRFEFWKNKNFYQNLNELIRMKKEASVSTITLREFYLECLKS